MKDVYKEAAKFNGLHEIRDNKELMAYLNKHNHKKINPKRTAWCAAFVNAVLDARGYKGTKSFMARSFLKIGKKIPLSEAKLGDIVVFKRGRLPWQGHVALFHRDMGNSVAVLGGNQSNEVNIKYYRKNIILGVRRLEK